MDNLRPTTTDPKDRAKLKLICGFLHYFLVQPEVLDTMFGALDELNETEQNQVKEQILIAIIKQHESIIKGLLEKIAELVEMSGYEREKLKELFSYIFIEIEKGPNISNGR